MNDGTFASFERAGELAVAHTSTRTREKFARRHDRAHTEAAITLLRDVSHQPMTTEARCILWRAANHLSGSQAG